MFRFYEYCFEPLADRRILSNDVSLLGWIGIEVEEKPPTYGVADGHTSLRELVGVAGCEHDEFPRTDPDRKIADFG